MKVSISQKQQTSTFKPLETIQMSIADSEESRVMMFETLLTQYQFPIQTGVQEIVSNARDSHRVAQTNKAIDIQFPTDMNPEWYCRDYGTGIAPDNMSIFMTLFQSTKRDNNGLTGGFGLGCKSFYAYTDSFTVVSYYNGEMRTYRASRAKNPLGELSLLSCVKTDEPNGIKIQVAVKPSDRGQFKNAVLRLMTYWKEQPINVINDKSIKIEKPLYEIKNISILPYNYSGSNIELVIDGIPYGTKNFQSIEISKFQQNLKGAISIEINNGDVELSKFREYIIVSESNKDKIHNILKDTVKTITALKMEVAKNNIYNSISEIKADPYKMIFSYFNDCPAFIMLDNKKVEATIYERSQNNLQLRIPMKELKDKVVFCNYDDTRVVKYSRNISTEKEPFFAIDLNSEVSATKFAYIDNKISFTQANLKINYLTKNNRKNNIRNTIVLSNITHQMVVGSKSSSEKISDYGVCSKELLPLIKFINAEKVSEITIVNNSSNSNGSMQNVKVVKQEKQGNYYKISTTFSSALELSSYSVDQVITDKLKKTLFKTKTAYINNKDLLSSNQIRTEKSYLLLKDRVNLLVSFGYNVIFIPKKYEDAFVGVENLYNLEDLFKTKIKPSKEEIKFLMTNFISHFIHIKHTIKTQEFETMLKLNLHLKNETDIIKLITKKNTDYWTRPSTQSSEQYEKALTSYVENGNIVLKGFNKEVSKIETVLEKYSFFHILRIHGSDKKDMASFTQLVNLINKGK
jgi:hypothetical protein